MGPVRLPRRSERRDRLVAELRKARETGIDLEPEATVGKTASTAAFCSFLISRTSRPNGGGFDSRWQRNFDEEGAPSWTAGGAGFESRLSYSPRPGAGSTGAFLTPSGRCGKADQGAKSSSAGETR